MSEVLNAADAPPASGFRRGSSGRPVPPPIARQPAAWRRGRARLLLPGIGFRMSCPPSCTVILRRQLIAGFEEQFVDESEFHHRCAVINSWASAELAVIAPFVQV